MCVLIAIYVCWTPVILSKIYFYPVLILLFILNEALIYLMLVTRVGFYARISDPSIGGTYITLLTTLGNLGASLSLSGVYYAAEWIQSPKIDYPLLVGICFVLGLIWMWTQYGIFKDLQALPLQKWRLSTKSLETGCTDAPEPQVQNEDQANLENEQFIVSKPSS